MRIITGAVLSVFLTLASFTYAALPRAIVYIGHPLDDDGNVMVAVMNPNQNVTVLNLPVDDEGNVMVSIQEEPLQTFTAAAGITVYDASIGHPDCFAVGYGTDPELPFAFSPMQEFQRVTDLWVTLVITCAGYSGGYRAYVKLNGHTIYFSIDNYEGGETPSTRIASEHVTNPSILAAINQGLNLVEVRNPNGYNYRFFLDEVSVFIEYEYQA